MEPASSGSLEISVKISKRFFWAKAENEMRKIIVVINDFQFNKFTGPLWLKLLRWKNFKCKHPYLLSYSKIFANCPPKGAGKLLNRRSSFVKIVENRLFLKLNKRRYDGPI